MTLRLTTTFVAHLDLPASLRLTPILDAGVPA
jgi:hypothetical protein